MLRHLAIQDFVIVDRLEFSLAAGFSVLTGETGAGKSILVDALDLVVGGRAESGVVRDGATRAEVAAEFEFDTSHPLQTWLDTHELNGDPGVLLLRRVIEQNGRSRAWINGHVATLAQLREAGEGVLDIHGQHAHQSLLRPVAQRQLLDTHAGLLPLVEAVSQAYRAWQRCLSQVTLAQTQQAALQAERVEVDARVTDLKRLAPEPGEWARLAAEHARLSNASALIEGAHSALQALSENEPAMLTQMAAIQTQLQQLCAHDAGLAPIVELLDGAQAQAAEAVRELRHYGSSLDLDPQALQAAEHRVEALHAAARRYRIKPEQLADFAQEQLARLTALAQSSDIAALQSQLAELHAVYVERASQLTTQRKAAAAQMANDVTEVMQTLAMSGARLGVQLRPLDQPAAHGMEDIDIEVAAHASLPLRPLARVASGGELSRISLAIQMVASKASPVQTMIFDEVDTGIGGAVAEVVGRALKQLGAERQVLAVTHLPQVAAQANAQWRVTKSGAGERVTTQLIALDAQARIEEIARMLGGTQITSTTRQHATELLAQGANTAPKRARAARRT